MKFPLTTLTLALSMCGCQHESYDLHFGPSPGDGEEEIIIIEDVHDEKRSC